MKKKVSVTLSGFFSSVLSGKALHHRSVRGVNDMPEDRNLLDSAQPEELRRCKNYRKFFPMTEIALPATALTTHVIAKWARDHRVAVDVRTGEELAAAMAAGVRLARLTVFADSLRPSELQAVANLGVGRIVVGSVHEIELLRFVVSQRAQNVVVRMTDGNMPALAIADGDYHAHCGFRFDSNEADSAVAAVIDHEWLNLVGLHCEVGSEDHDFVSYPAAIGHMIAEMAQIRRNHDHVLTRLGLGGGRAMPSGDWAVELPQLATQIDDALDDACGTLRFPRPLVVLSAGLEIVGRSAA